MLERIRESVFVVGVVDANTGVFEASGTAWTLDRKHLVTNAHVAEQLMKSRNPRDRVVAKRGVFDREEIVIGDMLLHPAYKSWNSRLRNMMTRGKEGINKFNPVSVSDIALLVVSAGDPGTPLKVMTDKNAAPVLLDEIFYVGFPTEAISGFATLRTVPMRVSAITDFFFRPVSWRDGELLHLCGHATGGASGSPVFSHEGVVIGVLSAADHVGVPQSERDAASPQTRFPLGFVYAQRVELAIELREGTAHERQRLRDPAWQQIVKNHFLPPKDLIDLLLRQIESESGIGRKDWESVTQQDWVFAPGESSSRNKLDLRLDSGYVYLFVAVSDDGTDIDGRLRDGGVELTRDQEPDHYPLLVYPNQVLRSDAYVEFFSAEELLGATEITFRVFRVPYSRGTQPSQEEILQSLVGIEIEREEITTSRDGGYTHTLTFEVQAEQTYTVIAISRAERDIDLIVRQNDRVLARDVDRDHTPTVRFTPVAGNVEITVVIPSNSRAEEIIDITIRSQAADVAAGAAEAFSLSRMLEEAEIIHQEIFEIPRDGHMSHRFPVQLEQGFRYIVFAKSMTERDIDLIARQSDRVVARDEEEDDTPTLIFEDVSGRIDVELLIPYDSRRGEEIMIVVMRI